MWNPFRRVPDAPPATLSPEQIEQQHIEEIRHWVQRSFGQLISIGNKPGRSISLLVQAPEDFRTLGYNGEGNDFQLAVSALHELFPDVQVVTKYLGRLDREILEMLDPTKPILQIETGPSRDNKPNVCDFRLWPPGSSQAKIDEMLAYID